MIKHFNLKTNFLGTQLRGLQKQPPRERSPFNADDELAIETAYFSQFPKYRSKTLIDVWGTISKLPTEEQTKIKQELDSYVKNLKATITREELDELREKRKVVYSPPKRLDGLRSFFSKKNTDAESEISSI